MTNNRLTTYSQQPNSVNTNMNSNVNTNSVGMTVGIASSYNSSYTNGGTNQSQCCTNAPYNSNIIGVNHANVSNTNVTNTSFNNPTNYNDCSYNSASNINTNQYPNSQVCNNNEQQNTIRQVNAQQCNSVDNNTSSNSSNVLDANGDANDNINPNAIKYSSKYVSLDGVNLDDIPDFSSFGITTPIEGPKMKIEDVVGKVIYVNGYKIEDSKFGNSRLRLKLTFLLDGETHITFTGSRVLMEQISKLACIIPFRTVIKKSNQCYTFT